MPDKNIEIELDVSGKYKEVCWAHLPPVVHGVSSFPIKKAVRDFLKKCE